MEKHEVTAEFVDQMTGTRYAPAPLGHPPHIFKPHDEKQRQRLIGSGCLSAEPATDITEKPLEELTRVEMQLLAVTLFEEQISTVSDDDLRNAIRNQQGLALHYNASAGADPSNDLTDPDASPPPQDPAATVRDQIDNDGLFDNTVEELKKLAVDEKIELGTATLKADIVAAIRAARAAG